MKQPISNMLLLCCVIAAIFTFMAAYHFIVWRQFKNEYEKTAGVIIKNKVEINKLEKKKSFIPVIRFKTLDNQKVSFTAYNMLASKKYHEGDTVFVYYDLLNADDVHIAGEEYRSLLIYSLLALLFGIISGYGILYTKKDN